MSGSWAHLPSPSWGFVCLGVGNNTELMLLVGWGRGPPDSTAGGSQQVLFLPLWQGCSCPAQVWPHWSRAWPLPVGWCPSMPSAWSQGGAWCPGLGVPPAALLPGWGGGTALAPSPRKRLAHWVLLCDSMIQTKLLLAKPSFSTSTWAYSMHTCVPMQCFVVVVVVFFSLLNNALDNKLWKVLRRAFLCLIIQLFFPLHF